MNVNDRQPYHGAKRRLVLAFDLGTTFSGISYAVLDPGQVPKISTVSRYPGQEAGDSKIQTVIYYDANGRVVATGAEEPPTGDGDEDDDWEDVQPQKLEWFKLILRPRQTASSNKNIPTPKLPPSKDIVDVYADFYRYLFARARDYIRQTHASGDSLWNSVAGDIDFVLSHPNGWDGAQQNAMRRAAVKAGLVPDTPSGRERVTFVSEGEASFHYCVSSGRVADAIKTGNNVMVIDAGGGTIDLSTYTFAEASPITIKEIAAPGCIFEGSVIVRKRAEQHLVTRLGTSKFSGKAYIDSMVEEFDKNTKKRFKPGVGDSYVKFSNMTTDRDMKFGIRNGQIKLTKEEVSGFFDPGVEEIILAIKDQQAATHMPVSTYFLVGGFAASEYLYSKLNTFLGGQGSTRTRPSQKGTQVSETTTFMRYFYYLSHHGTNSISCTVAGYRGSRKETPLWRDEDPAGFSDLCTISGDVSRVPKVLRLGPGGETFYRQDYYVVLSFGLTEFKAHLEWEQGGVRHRGPASVIYEDDFVVTVSDD
ncbi:hypothetical protein OF83DRAFT_1173833 [Amylostereum chailletii]|nr:hypothetical protein OF83DRAFT_1173833 [Amylostereum chailletii]